MSIITNALNAVAQRLNFISQFSGSGIDSKRATSWATFGYPDGLSFEDYRKAYERGGAGFGAVHKMLAKCWEECPKIYEGAEPQADDAKVKTAWEKEVSALLSSPTLLTIQRLVDFDRRNLVGRYSALIYQIADNEKWDKPVKKTSAVSNRRLVRLIPAFESQIRVPEWNSDNTSEQYGQPKMYQFRTREDMAGDTQGQPEEWVDIHPDRIQILAEGSSYGMFEGTPYLRAGYNNLISIDKVQGGSAECFLKNASRQIVVEFDANADVPTAVRNGATGEEEPINVGDELNEQMKLLNSNSDAAIALQGGKVTTLQSQMSDPEPSWLINANSFSASVQIPFTILFGQQTGRLASDEDKKDFAKTAKARQFYTLTPMLYEFITRMMAIGQISTTAAFNIEWPDLLSASDKEKLENGKALMDMNKSAPAAGQSAPFDENEVRVACGYAKKTDFPVVEGSDDAQVP